MIKFRTAIAALIAALLALLAAPLIQPASAATAPVSYSYAAYSMKDVSSAGQYWSGNQVAGQWSWSPRTGGESRISWGDPATWPPTYNEQMIDDGTWVKLTGWFNNGMFYRIKVTSQWQANADCRTGRVFLPTGGPQNYVRSTFPGAAYCLYAEATVTEEPSGRQLHYVHQQIWSPPAACPVNPNPVLDLNNKVLPVTNCVQQWEFYAHDKDRVPYDFVMVHERTITLAQGLGENYRVRQTAPTVWSADLRYAWRWA